MKRMRKLRSDWGAVEVRFGGLELVIQKKRSKKSKTEKKRKRLMISIKRKVGNVDRVGKEVTFFEDSENKKEMRKRKEEKEKDENLEVAAPCGKGGTAAAESGLTSLSEDGTYVYHYHPKKVRVRGLPYDFTDDDTCNYFAKCGEISGMYFRGNCFRSKNFTRCITFATEAGATKSLECDGSDIGCSLWVRRSVLSTQATGNNPAWGYVQKTPGLLTVKLGNLSENVDEESIRAFFKESFRAFFKESYSATNIEFVLLFRTKNTRKLRRNGYVCFGDDESVEAAVKLNETCLLGKPIKVVYGMPPKQWDESEQKPYPSRYKDDTCYTCGEKGHVTNFCPKKVYRCTCCGRDGHHVLICSERGFYGRTWRRVVSEMEDVQRTHIRFLPLSEI